MFGEHVRVWGHASRRDGLFSCVAFLGLVGRVPRGETSCRAGRAVGAVELQSFFLAARAALRAVSCPKIPIELQTDSWSTPFPPRTRRRSQPTQKTCCGAPGSLKHETLRLEPRRAADRGARRRGGGGQHDGRDERAPGGPAAPHLRVRADRRRDPVLPAPESICLLGQHAQVPGGHGERALRRHRPPLQRPQIRARRPRRRRHAQTASVDR